MFLFVVSQGSRSGNPSGLEDTTPSRLGPPPSANPVRSKFLILRVPFPPRYLPVEDELGCFARNPNLAVPPDLAVKISARETRGSSDDLHRAMRPC